MATGRTRHPKHQNGRQERLDRYVATSILLHAMAAGALVLWGPTFGRGATASLVPIRVISYGDLGGFGSAGPPAASAAPPASLPPAPVARTPKTARLVPSKRKPVRGPSEAPRPTPSDPAARSTVPATAPAPEAGTSADGPASASVAGQAEGRGAGQPAGPGGGGAPGAAGPGEPDFREYLEQVRRKVIRAWQESYEAEGAQTVMVRLRIQRSGLASGIQVIASTNSRINPSVVAAVGRASPFPPIPEPLKALAGEPIVLRLSLTPE